MHSTLYTNSSARDEARSGRTRRKSGRREEDIGLVPSAHPIRAPRDDAPYERGAYGAGRADCIGCRYVAESEDDQAAFRQMHELITSHHGVRCSDMELVSMVHAFYNREIRPYNTELGEWTHESIYDHIYRHVGDSEIQTRGLIDLLFTQIQSLRDVTWSRDDDTGESVPNVNNIKLMNDLIARHQALSSVHRRKT